jgi:hypothetical protein
MKWLRLVLLVLGSLILLSAISLSIAFWKYEEQIKQMVVDSLNQKLRTEIEVKGIELSLWNNFPKVALDFDEVVIHAVDAENDTLIAAERIRLELNLYELYQKKYKITGLQIENGNCHMVVDNSGRANYLFWEADSTEKTDLSIKLDAVKLINTSFLYEHFPNDVELFFKVERSKLNGQFSKSIFELEVEASLSSTYFRNGEQTFIDHKPLEIVGIAEVSTEAERLDVGKAKLKLEALAFNTKGSVSWSNDFLVDLEFDCPYAKIEEASSLLPQKLQNRLAQYELKGNAQINGSLKGPLNAVDHPSYQLYFTLSDGSFTHRKSGFEFYQTDLNGILSNGSENDLTTTNLILEKVSTRTKEGQIEGKGKLMNFKRPEYRFDGNIKMGLTDLLKIAEVESIDADGGEIDARLSWSGKMEKLEQYTLNDWKRSSLKGECILKSINLRINGLKHQIKDLNGEVNLNNQTLSTQNLSFSYHHGRLGIGGQLSNLISYLTEENKSLLIDASLKGDSLNLDELVDRTERKVNTGSRKGKITMYLDGAIEEVAYQQHKLNELKAYLLWKGDNLAIRNASFNYLSGSVKGDFFVSLKEGKGYRTFANADLTNFELGELFEQFNDFGQSTIQHQHLEGIASATVDLAADWNTDWELVKQSLKVESNLLVDQGKLIDFKPLEKLASYIDLSELKRVEFKSLQNQILIKDETVYIPRFHIESSAMNLTLEGKHDFNNNIEYRFELLLNELLGKKVKKPEHNEFGYVEDDGLGRTKVFMKMIGHVDNPKIAYDGDQLKVHLNKKLKEEKQTVKRLLNEEFGLFKKDSFDLPTSTPRKSPFQIEWDEEKQKVRADSTNPKKAEKKSRFGKFIDKIAKPNEDEYVEPDDN